MSDLKILTLNEYSLIDFINLVNEVFEDYTVPIKWDVISFELDAKENSISLKDSFIFFKEKKPIGFIVNSIRHDRARIDAMGVIKEERGTGTASFILEHATNYLKWKGIKNITLEVIEKDKRAFRFYEKHGFRKKRNLHLLVNENITESSDNLEYKIVRVEPKYVYSLALNLEISGRKPNWQREPITLLLADGRYNHEKISYNGTEGYLVWGKNKEDNSAYIVDIGTKNEKALDIITKIAINFLKKETDCNIISATSVPEDDPMFSALKNNGFLTILKQAEMNKNLQ